MFDFSDCLPGRIMFVIAIIVVLMMLVLGITAAFVIDKKSIAALGTFEVSLCCLSCLLLMMFSCNTIKSRALSWTILVIAVVICFYRIIYRAIDAFSKEGGFGLKLQNFIAPMSTSLLMLILLPLIAFG